MLRDVDAELAVEKGALAMPRLKFTTPEGLVVEASGEAADLPKAPRGAVRALVDAPSEAALRAFVTLLDLDADSARQVSRLARAVPLRLAGTMRFEGDGTRDIMIDGALQGGRVAARVGLGAGANLGDAPLDFTLTFDGVNVEKTALGLFEGVAAEAAASGKPGSLIVKAAGIPTRGLETLAELSSEGTSLNWRGRLTTGGTERALSADGRFSVSVPDARPLFAAAGLPPSQGLSGVAASGQLDARLRDGALELKSTEFALGASNVKGSVTIGPSRRMERPT